MRHALLWNRNKIMKPLTSSLLVAEVELHAHMQRQPPAVTMVEESARSLFFKRSRQAPVLGGRRSAARLPYRRLFSPIRPSSRSSMPITSLPHASFFSFFGPTWLIGSTQFDPRQLTWLIVCTYRLKFVNISQLNCDVVVRHASLEGEVVGSNPPFPRFFKQYFYLLSNILCKKN